MSNPWNLHHGEAQPVADDEIVRVLQRNGDVDMAPSGKFGWAWRNDHLGQPWAGDIVAWRLAEVKA